jgi:ubiquinone/menaquinone biosynthesis C-methylase UbiE
MRLSPAEFNAMNTRNRERLMSYEFRAFTKHLERHGIDLTGKEILDAGCGPGFSTVLIARHFRPSRLVAFDLMPEMIDIATSRPALAEFYVKDIASTGFPAESFDAVFIFDVLHHVPEWREAVREMSRLLRPGGVLLAEEPANQLTWFGDFFRMHHPIEAKFGWSEFRKELREAGFEILGGSHLLLGAFRNYLCRKGSPSP